MKRVSKILAMALTFSLLFAAATGCKTSGGGDTPNDSDKPSTSDSKQTDKPDDNGDDKPGTPAEGKDTNNGRPYNLTPTSYDSRDDKYLNGINATVLPITEDSVTISIWRSFSSTVMQGMEENLAIQELEKRTGVKIEWLYPPSGNENENYTLRINSDQLPHIFSMPPNYPGGVTKAIDDEVYADLTPYYDDGLMPNIQYLRENNAEFDKDFMDDEGRMTFFPMVDIVPSHPWSGFWVRQDWLDELGLDLPTTIDDWDTMLRKMKDMNGTFPLATNIKDWYGVKTNYMFAGSYESAYQQFINKDGTVVYGSIEPGYEDFLKLLNGWYADGILDPDFATRTNDDYFANVANGAVGAFGLAYGEMGQQKLTGQSLDPDWEVTPVLNPTSYDGQVIHLHQNNSTVRSDREFMTVQAIDDGIAEVLARWKDYWYSQDGGDLMSYGPEGVSYEWDTTGDVKWIFPELEETTDADFWTLYPKFKLHNYGYLRDSTSYEFEPEVFECIDTWSTQDASWLMPDGISFTSEESRELSTIMTDVETFVEERTATFITGQTPLSEFQSYVDHIKSLNIDRAVEIYQAALDRYNQR